jgi:hypothetical protein
MKKYLFVSLLIVDHLFAMQINNAEFDATHYIEKNLLKRGWSIRDDLADKLYNSKFMKLVFNQPRTIFDSYRVKLRENAKKSNKITDDSIKQISTIVKKLNALKFKIKSKTRYDHDLTVINSEGLDLLDFGTPSWSNYSAYLISELQKPVEKKDPGLSFVTKIDLSPHKKEKDLLVAELLEICNKFVNKGINDPHEFFPNYVDPFSLIDESVFKSMKKLTVLYMNGWTHGENYELLRTIAKCCPKLKRLYITKDPLWTDDECVRLIKGFKNGNVELELIEPLDIDEDERSKTT